jgi:hypothetical protein
MWIQLLLSGLLFAVSARPVDGAAVQYGLDTAVLGAGEVWVRHPRTEGERRDSHGDGSGEAKVEEIEIEEPAKKNGGGVAVSEGWAWGIAHVRLVPSSPRIQI